MPTRSLSFAQLFVETEYLQVLPGQIYCRGFIFAIASAPEIPMPEQWMPWLIKPSIKVTGNTSFDRIAEGLMDGLRQALQKMRDGDSLLPEVCGWHSSPQRRQALTDWLTGLLSAHSQLEHSWQQAWTLAQRHPEKDGGIARGEDPATRLSRCLKLFSTLADVELAIQKRSKTQANALYAGLPKLAAQLPAMLREYVAIAGDLSAVLPNQFESYVQPVAGQRND